MIEANTIKDTSAMVWQVPKDDQWRIHHGVPPLDDGICEQGEAFETKGNSILTCVPINMMTFIGNVANKNQLILVDTPILDTWYPNPNLFPGDSMYSVYFDEGVSYGQEDDKVEVIVPTAPDGARTVTMTTQEFIDILVGNISPDDITQATPTSLVEPTASVPDLVIANTPNTPNTQSIYSVPTENPIVQADSNFPKNLSEDEKNFGMILTVLGVLAAMRIFSFFKKIDKRSRKVYPVRPRHTRSARDFEPVDSALTEIEAFDACREEHSIKVEAKAVADLREQIASLDDVIEGRVKPETKGLSSTELRNLYRQLGREEISRKIRESLNQLGKNQTSSGIKQTNSKNYEPPDYLRSDDQGNSTTSIHLNSGQIRENEENNHWKPGKSKGPFESPEDAISLTDDVVRRAKRIEDEFENNRKNDSKKGKK